MPSPTMERVFASRKSSTPSRSAARRPTTTPSSIDTAGKAGILAVRIGRSIRFLTEPIERMAAGRTSA